MSARPPYPAGVPDKFSAEGVVQKFPGNTTVCHIPADSPLISALQKVYETIQAHPLLSKEAALLPPSSWHMTVFEGVCDKIRSPSRWPAGKQQQPLEECTAEFATKLQQLGTELRGLGLAPPYHMRARGFDSGLVGVGIEVEGATPEEDQRMRRLRNLMAERLGFQAANHETYVFHVSIAYLLRHFDGERRDELDRVFESLLPVVRREFELEPVEFNTFDDMYAFHRVFYLGDE